MPIDNAASSATPRNTPTPMRHAYPNPSLNVEPKLIAKRYVVIDTIGEGGMGKVYRALDTVLTRQVAVKILPVDRNNATLHYTRFHREARAASHLDHPNIVKALDFGLTREGQPFFVMEHLQGETLEEMIQKRGRLSIDQFIEIFLQLCSAMNHAHREDVIHRDLKTTNIMISRHHDRDGECLTAHVLDFGIAKILYDANEQMVTHAGELIGTPSYMSPEQARGDETDGRSDIYSLGCLMFEVLTGVPPFKSKSSLEILQSHLFDDPPTLEEIARKPFPQELELIVARALEKDPRERYQTMMDVLLDLEHLDLVLSEKECSNNDESPAAGRDRKVGQDTLQIKLKDTLQITLVIPKRSTVLLHSSFWLLIAILTAAIIALLSVMQSDGNQVAQIDLPIELPFDIVSKQWAQAEFAFNNEVIPGLDSVPELELKELRAKNGNLHDQHLILRDSEAVDEDMRLLPSHENLIELDLSNTGVTEQCLSSVVLCPSIEQLVLNNTMINGSSLSKLEKLPLLQTLKMANCELTDADLERISKLTTLGSLSLDRNRHFTPKGLKFLTRLPYLSQLSLVGCGITDDSMKILAQIKCLKLLDLCKNDMITTDGLKPFTGRAKTFIRIAGCMNFKGKSMKELSIQYGISLEGFPI